MQATAGMQGEREKDERDDEKELSCESFVYTGIYMHIYIYILLTCVCTRRAALRALPIKRRVTALFS